MRKMLFWVTIVRPS